MHISKVTIQGFKCFRRRFELLLNDGLNIIVGNNEAGKSTILEAIHLTLSGLYNGRYLRNELSEYLFNKVIIENFKTDSTVPPEIVIELYFEGDGLAIFEGDFNSERAKNCGIQLKIALDERDRDLYNDYISDNDENVSLPIEYYELTWTTFAREVITAKNLPFKAALIDSSSNRYQNGSDIYLSHIIRNYLDTNQINGLLQAHRRLQKTFSKEKVVEEVNKLIEERTKQTDGDKVIKVDVDLSSKNAWEYNMLACVEDVPFQHIGKGYQAILKTKLALEHQKATEANIIMIEEPENHLSHSKLNQLLNDINEKCEKAKKQIIISTHNSFVANKLGLDKLILLNNKKTIRLNDLSEETIKFFRTISGYDTLRLILCNSAILCEGDSDELIVQKCYFKKHKKLPIQSGIEVISVGLSFKRYIEIALKLDKKIAVVTDNDKKSEILIEKYKTYNDDKDCPIKVFFDTDDNYSTLEPQLVKHNRWNLINQIVDAKYKKDGANYKKGEYKCNNEDELLIYMENHKTDCAIKFFDTEIEFEFPAYIEEAINYVEE
ncbi:MAG: AAA family ATPase [Bacteroidales bacterium]|nr:AAA family ATPase [Bacteroidales bacterium]